MSSRVRARLVCAALLLCTHAHAGPLRLDLSTALARARERAPDALAARARIVEANARRGGAGALANPELQLGGGMRLGDPRTLALRGQLVQPLEPWRRGAREDVAAAEHARAQAVGEVAGRELARTTANAFYEARFAELAVEVATRGEALAVRMLATAERRRKGGDLTDLDLDLAKLGLGRARAALSSSRAERAAAVGVLAILVGAAPDDAITLAGELGAPELTLAQLQRGNRADVRAFEADAEAARAEGALAAANGRPDIGLWFGYERDEQESIVVGGLLVTLPLWNRARAEKAGARAKLRGAEAARVAATGMAAREVVDAFEAYTHAREAVLVMERDALPAIVDGEGLLERSIDAGQLAIADYLLIHQQILDGRREYLERRLAAAKAALAAQLAAGVTP
jgi:cobalt-zinc-cadmium efflux system outer membrane protein